MAEGVSIMADSTDTLPIRTAIPATEVAAITPARVSANGIRFATFGEFDGGQPEPQFDIDRLVQAVPDSIAAALAGQIYYFVPLAMAEPRPNPSGSANGHRSAPDETMISPIHTAELGELAICHRNVELDSAPGVNGPAEGVFISTRLLSDRFALAFEFFINVGHAFVDTAGVPESFNELAWNQALADVRGETSQDAWEARNLALIGGGQAYAPSPRTASSPSFSSSSRRESAISYTTRQPVDEKAKADFLEAAYADSVAIYLLSLAVDFDYSELREREYPLLAPQALAERLRLIHRLFPPNPNYDFAIRYRRRA